MKNQVYYYILYFLLVFFIFIPHVYSENKIDSLEKQLQHFSSNDTNKINLQLELANAIGWNNASKMIEYATDAKVTAEKLNYKKGLFYAYQILAMARYVTGEYDKGLADAKMAYHIANKEKQNDWKFSILNTIGLLYQQLKKYKESVEYFEEIIVLQKNNPNADLSSTYNNIANSYMSMNLFEKSMQYRNKALTIRKNKNDISGIADCYNDIGENFLLKNEIDSAILYFKSCYKIKEEINDEEMLSLSALNLGKALIEKKRFAEAERYLNIALFYANKIGSKLYKLNTFNYLAIIANKQFNYKYEAELLNEIIRLKEDLLNEESVKQMNRLHSEFETEKKELKITQLLKEKKQQQIIAFEKEKRNKLIGFFLTGGVLLLCSFLLILNNRFRTTKKHKLEIEKQIVEQKQKETLDSIYYAKRIQNCMLPNEKHLQKKINELKKAYNSI
ncbi:MAG: tetratricopeptide repeat protein [Flavobacteriales bacterium]|nr:tetratricopeptide repeat protein [Flavobacteriales bacterium]